METGKTIANVPIPKSYHEKITREDTMEEEKKSLGKFAKWEDRVKNRHGDKLVIEFPKMIWGCQFMPTSDDLFTSSMDGRLLRWHCSKAELKMKQTFYGHTDQVR